MARHLLTDFELMILLATLRVGDAAYGVPIAAEIEAHRRPARRRRRGVHGARSTRAQRPGLVDDRRADARARRPREAIFSSHAAGHAGGEGNPARARRALEGCPSNSREDMYESRNVSARALASRPPRSSQRAARGRSARTVPRRALCRLALVAAAVGDRRGFVPSAARPVALNLTPIDPIVAEWLVSRKLPPRRVNLSSPVEGVGGLGMMMMGFLLSTVVPDVWWFVMGGIVCGVALGLTLAYRRRHQPMATDGQYPHRAAERSVRLSEITEFAVSTRRHGGTEEHGEYSDLLGFSGPVPLAALSVARPARNRS